MTKKAGRRRRNKKDVVLDFRKHSVISKQSNDSISKSLKKGGISLSTASNDYEGNLALPDKVVQREYESTGQFFRRLDRLVAKAKVEANMEARFDMTLPKEKKLDGLSSKNLKREPNKSKPQTIEEQPKSKRRRKRY